MARKPEDTAEFDPSAVLERMRRQEAPTEQVDVQAVLAAAADAAAPAEPRAVPSVIRREQPTAAFRAVHRPREPYAEIAVVGDDDIYALPLRQVSARGLAVAAAAEQAPLLVPGAVVVAHITLGEVELRLQARVDHRRAAGPAGGEGGIRLSWSEDGAPEAAIARLVAAWAAATGRG